MNLLHASSIIFLIAAFVVQSRTVAPGAGSRLERKAELGARQDEYYISDVEAGPLEASVYQNTFVGSFVEQDAFDNILTSEDDPDSLLSVIASCFLEAADLGPLSPSENEAFVFSWNLRLETSSAQLNVTMAVLVDSDTSAIFNEWTAHMIDEQSALSAAQDVENAMTSSGQVLICMLPWVHNLGWTGPGIVYVQDYGYNLDGITMPAITEEDIEEIFSVNPCSS